MGVNVEVLEPGTGPKPQPGDRITIHYRGTLANGNEFDSSYKRDQPFECTIGVGQVIRGWDEGVVQMSVGEKARLTITPDYGYGAQGFPPVIPGNSTLIFEVHLLDIAG
ncbi:Fork head 1, partial [Dispira parvispora]